MKSILLCAFIFFMVYLWSYDSLTIDQQKQDDLANMISSIERDHSDQNFCSYFKNQVNKDLNDQKIDNGEYKELKQIYDGYMLSKLTKNQNVFIQNLEKKQQDIEQKDKDIEQVAPALKWIVFMLFTVFAILCVISLHKVLTR